MLVPERLAFAGGLAGLAVVGALAVWLLLVVLLF